MFWKLFRISSSLRHGAEADELQGLRIMCRETVSRKPVSDMELFLRVCAWQFVVDLEKKIRSLIHEQNYMQVHAALLLKFDDENECKIAAKRMVS